MLSPVIRKHLLQNSLIRSVLLITVLATLVSGQSQQRPAPSTWKDNEDGFLNWLLTGCVELTSACTDGASNLHTEYEGYDGWYNNWAKPDQGAAETPLLRLLPPAYSDGVYQPANREANPFTVSDSIMKGLNGNTSISGKTAFLVFFGQQVVEEILDAQRPGCPPEYFNIPIPDDHVYRTEIPGVNAMPLLRSRYDMNTGFSPNNPRQQLNEITPYLDGGLVYGAAKGWADVLRTFTNGSLAPGGLLAWNDDEKLGRDFPAANLIRLPMANPPAPTNHSLYKQQGETAKVDRFFKLGNPRGNENPFLLSFGILLFRWHNKLATKLHEIHPGYSEERLFNEARKWVIATHQSIVMYDWLPHIISDTVDDYPGYKGTVDPQISHAFQSAAMRYGHTLVTSGVYLRDKASQGCGTQAYDLRTDGSTPHNVGVRTCNSFWRSPELFGDTPENVEKLLMGMSSQSSERDDNIIVDDLRGRVFGPLEFSRRDLMAVNIQRGRDHGLPDYNTARKHMGLTQLDSLDPDHFIQVTGTLVGKQVLEQLKTVYGTPEKTDIWAGGLMETKNGPGELFSKIIKDQFERIRDGDRFWFENVKNDQFTSPERERIRQMKIIDLVLSSTSLTTDDIQGNPFQAIHTENDLPLCNGVLVNHVQCQLPLRPFVVNASSITCRYLPALNDNNLELCTKVDTFDYFIGSEISYILTFFAVSLAAAVLLASMWGSSHLNRSNKAKVESTRIMVPENGITAKERVSATESRYVVVTFLSADQRIEVRSLSNSLLRTIDLQNLSSLTYRHLNDFSRVIICVEHHYDLYLKFSDKVQGHKLMTVLKNFCDNCETKKECVAKPENLFTIRFGVTTFKKRAMELAEFSRLVMTKAFNEETENAEQIDNSSSIEDLVPSTKSHLSIMQITKSELAEELGTDPESLFMTQLFRLMDKDKNGFILLKEFWEVMVVFARGTARHRAQFIFNVYDVNENGHLGEDDLKAFLQSMLGHDCNIQDIDAFISNIYESVKLKRGQEIDFETFFSILNSDENILMNINITGEKKKTKTRERFSIYGIMQPKFEDKKKTKVDRIDSILEKHDERTKTPEENDETLDRNQFFRYLKELHNNQVVVWWTTIYTIVMFLIFAERAYFYSVERESSGLRRIAGYGVTVTRGAASAMMFTYSTLLITMCRNMFTLIRSSFFHRWVPVDNMIFMHRYIGVWALVFTVMHVIGHAINFYHISTQTPSDLACLFRDFFRRTHELPKFHYWCWGTITGFTGVLLTLQCAVIYVMAFFARRHYFWLFWKSHNSYPLFYFLIILHGSGNLVQPPFFHYFFLGPVILFTLDKLVGTAANSVKIQVLEAEHLPSNVTLLKIRRPLNFNFQAGQWVRIASTAISTQEYHPFTISSAPHEPHLTLHIRAVGPWTTRLRKEYPDKKTVDKGHMYKQIYVDGPFGEGHQAWWDYEVSILVGAGIGVTPFASILKHIAHRCNDSNFQPKTKKVMFLWVTKSQKQFEWLTEILHEVEKNDKKGLVRNHLFITAFKNKFDLRTIFLYLAERHFQKASGRSLFTGLKAITHFARPPFVKIFRAVKEQYPSTSKVGVFTCGSPDLSTDVEQACRTVNEDGDNIIYKHYFENF